MGIKFGKNYVQKKYSTGNHIFGLTGIAYPLFAIELKTAAQKSTPKYFELEDNTMEGWPIFIVNIF